jgi:hypothetical protein
MLAIPAPFVEALPVYVGESSTSYQSPPPPFKEDNGPPPY